MAGFHCIDKIRDITPLPHNYLSNNLSHCQDTKILLLPCLSSHNFHNNWIISNLLGTYQDIKVPHFLLNSVHKNFKDKVLYKFQA